MRTRKGWEGDQGARSIKPVIRTVFFPLTSRMKHFKDVNMKTRAKVITTGNNDND